jgi:hypothetical protein
LHAVTPHVAQNDSVTATGKRRRSAIDGRTTRHQGYGMSQSCRAMTECIFGWGKRHGTMRKTQRRGIAGVAADFLLNLIAYNLIRIPKLVAARQNSTLIREDNGSVSRFFRKLLDLIDELDPTLFRRGAFSCGRSGNRAADIFRMAGHMLGQRLLLCPRLVVSVDDVPQPFPRRRD